MTRRSTRYLVIRAAPTLAGSDDDPRRQEPALGGRQPLPSTVEVTVKLVSILTVTSVPSALVMCTS